MYTCVRLPSPPVMLVGLWCRHHYPCLTDRNQPSLCYLLVLVQARMRWVGMHGNEMLKISENGRHFVDAVIAENVDDTMLGHVAVDI